MPELWWEAATLIRRADRLVQPLAALSPLNFAEEFERLLGSLCTTAAQRPLAKGSIGEPAFVYRALSPELPALQKALEELLQRCLDQGEPMADLFADRINELLLESELARARDSKQTPSLARERYRVSADLAAQADQLAAEWLADLSAAAPAADDLGPMVTSDDASEPRSLLSRMREEVFRRRLPVRVKVKAGMAPLAAVGNAEVWIASGRRLRVGDVERTVLHEVLGHLMPQLRAPMMDSPLFAVGSRQGSDGQEGYALWIEREHGHLFGPRRRVLALRHIAARGAHEGAGAEELFARIRPAASADAEALRIVLRALRGGGLGRESCYLPNFLAADRASQHARSLLACGRLSSGAAEVLAQLGVQAKPLSWE